MFVNFINYIMTNIYRLVSIEKECEDDQYIMAVSYDKNVLENILATVKPQLENQCNFAIKENTELYKVTKFNGSYFIVRTSKLYEGQKLHGFNKITTYKCEQVLIDLNGQNVDVLDQIEIFKDNLSRNNIEFDTYYDEGIMNA